MSSLPVLFEMVGVMDPKPVGTVFVVDDDDAVRRLIQSLVNSVGLPAELYTSAEQFLSACDPQRPGCLVTDVRMPGMSGLDLQQALARRGISLPVIMVTAYADVPLAVQAMKSHAVDVMQKPFRNQELLDRIQQALRADAERRRQDSCRAESAARLSLLSEREREVLDLVVAGLPNKQIAHRLHLSEKTVEAHRGKVMR